MNPIFSKIMARIGAALGKLLPFNSGNRKVQAGVALFLLLLFVAFATKCRAADSYVQVLGGQAMVRGEAPAMDLSVVWPDAGPGDASLAVGVTFTGDSEWRANKSRANAFLRTEIIDGFGHFDVGFGVAYLQHDDEYNSCRMNFSLSLGYRFQFLPITARYQHYSNGATCAGNSGRDILLVGWRFR